MVCGLLCSLRTDYSASAEYVRAMRVVNDCAERGVAMMQSFNGVLTKNEDQTQYILQVVEEHRRKFPDARKVKLV